MSVSSIVVRGPLRRDLSLLALLVVLSHLPFLARPFHIDDRIYLEISRQARTTPLFPQDYHPVFEGKHGPDAASHSLSFVGGAFGAQVVPLGMDDFGQSGTIPDLYRYAGIDADHIVEGAILALELEAD